MSYFEKYAKHPKCVLAVDASDGGKWKSSFKSSEVMPSVPTGGGSFEDTLLQKSNVTATGGKFSYTAAGEGYIRTPLDLRGYYDDFTVLAKAYIPKYSATSGARYLPLLMQGRQLYSGSAYPTVDYSWRFWLDQWNSLGNRINFQIAVLTGAGKIEFYYKLPEDFDYTKEHVFAYSVKMGDGTVRYAFFVDGVIKKWRTINYYNFFPYCSDSGAKVTIFDTGTVTTYQDTASYLTHGMIFKTCLGDDEIKFLSRSLLPEFVTASGGDTPPEESEADYTTPTNLTANDSDSVFECYTVGEVATTNANSDAAYKAAKGSTTFSDKWICGGGTVDTSCGVRFVWKKKDLTAYTVKKVIIGNTWQSVFPQKIANFKLQGSNDGTTWEDVGTTQNFGITPGGVYTEKTFDYSTNTTKYKFWAIYANFDQVWTDIAYSQLCACANRITFTNII